MKNRETFALWVVGILMFIIIMFVLCGGLADDRGYYLDTRGTVLNHGLSATSYKVVHCVYQNRVLGPDRLLYFSEDADAAIQVLNNYREYISE